MADDSGEPPRTPGSSESPEGSETERWKSVQPLPNWRQQHRQGLLSRHPALGVALVAVLAAGAALAVIGAVRSVRKTSAAGSAGGALPVAVVRPPSIVAAYAHD